MALSRSAIAGELGANLSLPGDFPEAKWYLN